MIVMGVQGAIGSKALYLLFVWLASAAGAAAAPVTATGNVNGKTTMR